MRFVTTFCIAGALALSVAGCTAKKPFDGPTVEAFNGKLVADGKPVSFPADEDVSLDLFHQTGQKFGIPIKKEGTFQIGWMPIGKYSAMLVRDKKVAGKGAGKKYNVPGGLTIRDELDKAEPAHVERALQALRSAEPGGMHRQPRQTDVWE